MKKFFESISDTEVAICAICLVAVVYILAMAISNLTITETIPGMAVSGIAGMAMGRKLNEKGGP